MLVRSFIARAGVDHSGLLAGGGECRPIQRQFRQDRFSDLFEVRFGFRDRQAAIAWPAGTARRRLCVLSIVLRRSGAHWRGRH